MGVVLSTQNPVDLDYKGLTNAGTWFIGRLQTERDKGRLLDGLEGAAISTQEGFSRQDLEQTIGALGKRVFLMNNVHDSAPAVFQTRWAMSYLPGPLTRDQIKLLMDPLKATTAAWQAEAPAPAGVAAGGAGRGAGPAAAAAAVSGVSEQPPVLPSDVRRYFMPPRGRAPAGGGLLYRPQLLGAAQVSFADTKTGTAEIRDGVWLVPITDEAIPVNWDDAQQVEFAVSDLDKSPPDEARYAELPPAASQARSYATWSRQLATWLYGSQRLELLQCASLREVSRPGESEREFRIRLQQAAREKRDDEAEKLRTKYASKLATLEERVRKAEQAVDREKDQARTSGLQTGLSLGATLLGALTGRKKISASTLGKATTTARGAARSMGAQQDVERAKETLEAAQQQLAELEAEFEAEKNELSERLDPLAEELTTVAIKPKKADISVELVALAWAPYWQDADGVVEPAW